MQGEGRGSALLTALSKKIKLFFLTASKFLFSFFGGNFFFQFNRFSLREPAGVTTTNSGVAFDGIFENPIEMGGFRGVRNGISA